MKDAVLTRAALFVYYLLLALMQVALAFIALCSPEKALLLEKVHLQRLLDGLNNSIKGEADAGR